MTGSDYRGQAERLAEQAHRYTYGDGADPVTGAALAAEAQVYATLALATATEDPSGELAALREAVAALLHDAATSPDSELSRAADTMLTWLREAGAADAVEDLAEGLMWAEAEAAEYDAVAGDAESAAPGVTG